MSIGKLIHRLIQNYQIRIVKSFQITFLCLANKNSNNSDRKYSTKPLKNNISLKEINKLAIPAILAGIAEPVLSMVDTAFVGHLPEYGKESLAAVGLVGVFLSMIVWILGQTRSAISTIISQYLGAGNLEKIKNLPAQAIFSIVTLSLIIIAITYPIAPFIFKLYNADAMLLDLSVQYFRIRVFGLPFTLFTFAVFGTFSGLQNTTYPMYIAITGAVLNMVLDYFLIYGVTDYIVPLGVKGAAYASVIAQFVMAILAAYFLLRKTPIRLKLNFPWNHEMRNLTKMILHLFVRTIALNVALYLGSSFATKYGKDSIAAYTIAINIWFFFAFFVDGYSSAGNILAGKLYGAKSYAKLSMLGKKLTKYSIVLGLVIAAISFVLYYPIGRVFIEDEAVLNKFYSIFWIVLLMQPINGIAFIFDGIFKGMGYMKYLRNVLLIATFMGFLPVILITDYYQLELYGIWIAFSVWMLLRGGILLNKFRSLNIFTK